MYVAPSPSSYLSYPHTCLLLFSIYKAVFQHYVAGTVITGTSCGTKLDHNVLAVGFGHDAKSGLDYWKIKVRMNEHMPSQSPPRSSCKLLTLI